MWKRLAIFIPLVVTSLLEASPLKTGKHYDYSKGLDTYHSSLSLSEGFVQRSLNVLFDANAPIAKRQGDVVAFSSKSYSYQQEWTYVDPTNTSWIIVRASDSIIANNLTGSNSVLIATVAANNLIGEANAFGNAFFTDQTQGVYFWNGSSTTYVAGSPKGSLITQWHGRVWITGLAVPSGNQLWGSRQYDATSSTAWGTGVNPNDPVTLTVGLQDNFDNITALYPFLDTLYIFRHYSTYAVYGFDQTSFQLSFITSECGCVDQNSIQTYNHTLIFVSARGVESFNGYTCTRISDPVKNMVDASIQSQGGINTQSWLQSSQADWNAGTFTPSTSLSSVVSAPSLVLSTGAASDGGSSGFASGSFNSTFAYNGSVVLSTTNVDVTNNSFESGTSPWTFLPLNSGVYTQANLTAQRGGAGDGHCTLTPQDGTHFGVYSGNTVPPSTIEVDALECGDNAVLASVSFSAASNACTNTRRTISMSGLARKCVYLFAKDTAYSNASIFTSENFYTNGQDITFYTASDFDTIAAPGLLSWTAFDNFQSGKSTISSGTYTSRVIDTTLSPNRNILLSNAGWTASGISNGNSNAAWRPSFVTQHSNDGISFQDVGTSTNTNYTIGRYARYISTFSNTSNFGDLGSNISASLDSAAFQWEPSSGSFKSQIHAISSINSWGNFSVGDTLNSGAISFSVCSSTNSSMNPVGISPSCASQTPNSQITVSTGQPNKSTYVQWYATFTVTAATQTPTLQNGTVQWFSGSNAAPMASTVWDNRYWLSLTTSTTDSGNDAILVLNTAGAWALLDLRAGGLVQYKNSLYHSDSSPSGNVYLDNQGYRDNGNAINAYVQTKDYCGEDLSTEDYYESLYTSMDNFGNFNMTIQYAMDRANGTPYSLSSVNQTEYANNTSVKVPFVLNSSNQNFGKCINFTFAESDIDAPWLFYGFTTYSHPREVQ